LGHWLSEDVTGHGYATAAVAALLRYAGEELGATDVFAGVTVATCAPKRWYSASALKSSQISIPIGASTTR
jgi:hypothetical protein